MGSPPSSGSTHVAAMAVWLLTTSVGAAGVAGAEVALSSNVTVSERSVRARNVPSPNADDR